MKAGAIRRVLIAAVLLASAWPAAGTTVVGGGGGARVDGSGHVTEEVRAVSDFSKLELAAPVNVQLRNTGAERITLRGDDNILPLLETRVENGRLVVEVRKGASFRTRNRLTAVVEFKQLDGVSIRGSGDVRADRIKAAIFEGTIHGSGDVSIDDLTADTVALSIAGSGNFTARGRAGTVGVVIDGSGDVRVQDLEAKTVAVRISGSGDARVHATERLAVRIAGSGDVLYRGSPQVEKKIAGSGDVRPLR
jgi:hypothetical protein